MKRRGALTVELLLLMVVVLTTSSLILSSHLRVERHNQLFTLIEQAGQDTAGAIYAIGRLKTALAVDSSSVKLTNYQVLTRLVDSPLGMALTISIKLF